jgi:hypothetical protein
MSITFTFPLWGAGVNGAFCVSSHLGAPPSGDHSLLSGVARVNQFIKGSRTVSVDR